MIDRRKKVINLSEAQTRRLLGAAAARNGAEVHTKLRIADVLEIAGSGLDGDHFSYALKAHFDFVVCDGEHMPLFAVEFDGPRHVEPDVAKKDRMKNRLCEVLGLPLARVRDEHLFRKTRGVDYVTWLTEVHFAYAALAEAQEAGVIPESEPVDPMLFMSIPGLQNKFPLWLSVDARIDMRKQFERGRLTSPGPSCFTGEDSTGTTTCLAFVPRRPAVLLATTGSIFLRGFGVPPSEAAEEIAVVKLAEQARDVDDIDVDLAEVRSLLVRFLREHSHVIFGGVLLGSELGFTVRHELRNGSPCWAVGPLGEAPEVVIEGAGGFM